MPMILVDTEQADLIEVATYMLEQALTARAKRADPGKVITNSLTLQAAKLETLRNQLAQPDPPQLDRLAPAVRESVEHMARIIVSDHEEALKVATYEQLRQVINAAPLPSA